MKNAYKLLLAIFLASICTACAAMKPPKPKAPSSVNSVRVRVVTEGHSHDDSANSSQAAPSEEAIRAAFERQFKNALTQSGLRVVTSCESDDCAELEARVSSQSWVDEPPYGFTNARANITLVNLRDGEIVGQGEGAAPIAQDAQVQTQQINYIANTALDQAFKSPMLADASFDAPAPSQPNGPTKPDDSSQAVGGDKTFSHVGQPQPSAYAVVVGVQDYRDLPATPGSRADAEAFSKLLQTSLGVPKENIRTLIDDRATKSDLESALRWVKDNVPEKGRVYFYFSGHGAPDPAKGDAYLLPYEAKDNNIAHGGLAIDTVLENLGESRAGEVLAFVDSCFSGKGERSVIEEGLRPLVPIKKVAAADKIALFSASGAKEVSGSTADKDGGLFTHHLIAAVGNGEADFDGNGTISLDELETYVKPRVTRDAKKLSREQTPTLSIGGALSSPDKLLMVWGLSEAK